MLPKESKTKAKIKFIATPATITPALTPAFLEEKLLELFIASSPLYSPKIFTKPPKGIRLIEKIVLLLLSVLRDLVPKAISISAPGRRRHAKKRGGKPKPNSSTFIPALLAITKWPNS